MISKLRRITLICVAALGLSFGAAQSFEVGYQYDYRGHAAFAYVTHDFSLGNWGAVGLWFSPSLEVTFGPATFDAWVQAQFLIDAPAFTISVRGLVESIDSRERATFRVGVLLGR